MAKFVTRNVTANVIKVSYVQDGTIEIKTQEITRGGKLDERLKKAIRKEFEKEGNIIIKFEIVNTISQILAMPEEFFIANAKPIEFYRKKREK